MRVTDTERAMLKQNYEADRIARMLQFKVPFFMRIVATALIMAGLVFVVSVFKLPNPNMILISGLVICSALFGVPGGVVSAVAMLSYTFYFFSDNHDFVTFTPENMQKVLVTFVGVTIVGVFVCALKNAQSRALEDAYTLADLLKEDNELLEQASSIDTLTGLKNRFSLRRDYSRYVEEGKSLTYLSLWRRRVLGDRVRVDRYGLQGSRREHAGPARRAHGRRDGRGCPVLGWLCEWHASLPTRSSFHDPPGRRQPLPGQAKRQEPGVRHEAPRDPSDGVAGRLLFVWVAWLEVLMTGSRLCLDHISCNRAADRS